MNVSEYKLDSETGVEAFNKTVNEMINEGWQPFGGISSFFINLPTADGGHVGLGVEYSQAMVKYNNVIKV